MSKDFALFQSEFRKWQKLFGLSGYKVYFKYEPLEESFADTTITLPDMVVTARLNSKLPEKEEPFKNIKLSAKHEAIHLLVARLEKNGRYRYATDNELYEATEELVVKLESLIP